MSEFPVGELRALKGALVPAYRQIANELRRVIEVHKLPPGTKLPSETELVAIDEDDYERIVRTIGGDGT